MQPSVQLLYLSYRNSKVQPNTLTMRINKTRIVFILLLFCAQYLSAQGFLHREGKYIFDGSGNEVILRGIGTGNWMIQEGYMMKSSGVAGTQHEFRNKLIATIGEEKTDSFYTVWLGSHFRRIDVDSMKSWGFNSIRVAMHYKWFTPPIEDEPVPGEITWIEKGFTLMDSLVSWCSDNEMYLILDLHGAPGGQGKESNISDYDSSKPSLWESQANKDKTVALWKKLAERYSNEPWIGGYDLINETNWSFSAGNAPLWDLLKKITLAIREVDENHLIFIEGNWFANDYSGLPSIWDNNLALSFHKYWSYNDAGSLNWMINLRNSRNVPIWLGESGENSNVWFTNLVTLCEKNRIGWSWWPVKKADINNPLRVKVNSEYTRLIDYWKGSASNPGADAAFEAVLQFAENHRLENCIFQKDVVDALIRQPKTTETVPYKLYHTGEPVFASDYNLGRNGFAYFDNDTADYHGSTDNYIAWNQGWNYRNDGVDIEPCVDVLANNGFNVGWTGDGEWMEYTVAVDSTAAYTLSIRSASGSGGSKVHLEMDGKVITQIINLPGTSGWYNWKTTEVTEVPLVKGTHKFKFVFDKGGSNLNYFQFSNPVSADSIPFKNLTAVSSEDGSAVYLSFNKPVTSSIGDIQLSDFIVTVNNNPVEITTVSLKEDNPNEIIIQVKEPLFYGGQIKLSYQGNSIFSSGRPLSAFSNMAVTNMLPLRYSFPGRIQSEDFFFNNGMVSETCEDTGGGLNMGYAAPGDYLDYLVHVPESRYYTIHFRVATSRSNNQLIIRVGEGNSFTAVDTITISPTGDWQNWETVSTTVFLEEGRYTMRMYVKSGEFNTNWFQVVNADPVGISAQHLPELRIYPNPADKFIIIQIPEPASGNSGKIYIYNPLGQVAKSTNYSGKNEIQLAVSGLKTGMYYVELKQTNNKSLISKFYIK